MVDFADLVMFGDRIRIGLVQFAAMDHADADMRLADDDIADLLVEQLFRQRLFRIAFEFGCRNIGAGAHDAGRLRVGRIDPDRILRQRRRAEHQAQDCRKAPGNAHHDHLAVVSGMHARTARFAKFPGLSEVSVSAR